MAGKSHQDIELAARVRSLTLNECEKQLKKGKGKLYEAVLLKLAGTVLPRLNEVTGKDGGAIEIKGNKIAFTAFMPEDATDG